MLTKSLSVEFLLFGECYNASFTIFIPSFFKSEYFEVSLSFDVKLELIYKNPTSG